MRFPFVKRRRANPDLLPPFDTVTFLQQSQVLLHYGYTHAAGCMLRLAAERWVMKRASSGSRSLGKAVAALLSAQAISEEEGKRLRRIIDAGNKAAHGANVSPDSIRDRIKQLERMLNKDER